MKLPRFKIWTLCLAVAASAVMIKLALWAGAVGTVNVTLLFLGPLGGIVLDRYRGGTGVAGGVVAGILSGVALSAFMNIYGYRLGRPFSWFELAVSTTVYVMLEASCGWLWGRRWHLSMTKHMAAEPEGLEI
jgi:hypothetical protein